MFLKIELLLLYGCVPIKKFRTERYLIIRYFRHYCFSSITLSPRYGISSNLTFIVGLIRWSSQFRPHAFPWLSVPL